MEGCPHKKFLKKTKVEKYKKENTIQNPEFEIESIDGMMGGR